MTTLLGGDAAIGESQFADHANPAATADGFAPGYPRSNHFNAETIDAASGNPVVIDGELLLNGDYARVGTDLEISGADGDSVVLLGYFSHDILPTLTSPDGAMLLGKTVSLLAGPQSPGQYAQAGDTLANPIGEVALLEGAGSVQRANGVSEPLAQGAAVFEDDVISTADGSKLSLKFVDGTALTMSANARVVMDELVYDASRTDNSMVLNLVQGSFVFLTGLVAKTGTVRADTPVATMGIRGTTPTRTH